MPVHITIIGENSGEVLVHLRELAAGTGVPAPAAKATVPKSAEVKTAEPKVTEAEVVEETKPKAKKEKAKEEAKAEVKTAEVTPPAPTFTLNDAFERVRTIAGDGSDEKIMAELKAINIRLGVAKVRELPADKIDAYMRELDKSFPAGATVAASSVDDMFA